MDNPSAEEALENFDDFHRQIAQAIVDERFPNRHKRKIDWLQFEQDLRDSLRLKIDDLDKLHVISILIGEHTGRGYEL